MRFGKTSILCDNAQWEHFQKKWPKTLFSQNQEIKIFTQEARKKSYIFWNISNFW